MSPSFKLTTYYNILLYSFSVFKAFFPTFTYLRKMFSQSYVVQIAMHRHPYVFYVAFAG